MKNYFQILCCCVLMVLLAGCVRSVRPVYPDSAGINLLPANAVLVAATDKTIYKMAARGRVYKFDPAYSGGYKNALFVKFDNAGHYVAQALTDDKGYYYALVMKEGDSLNVYTFKAGELADSEGLSVTKRLDGSSVQIEDRDEMWKFYFAAIKHLDEAQKSTYKILDLDDPTQRKIAGDLTKLSDEKQAAESGGQTAKAKEKPVPSSSGAWSLVETTDPMTDAKITRIVGKPSTFEGTEDQPAMQVSCGKTGLAFAVYWGARMEDLYPTGEADFVAVDVRFDKSEPARLGWTVSSDWATTYNPNALAAGIGQLGQSMIEALLPAQKVILAWEEAVFHRNMQNANRLILRGSTRSGKWAMLEFDLSGYSDLAKAFPARCG